MTTPLTENQLFRFQKDLQDFLEGDRSGGLDIWSYVNGKGWEDLVEASVEEKSSYYLSTIEAPVLEENAGEIARIVQGDPGVSTLFIRGTGTGSKILPVVKALNGRLQHVLLFDLSREFTGMACDKIEAIRPDLAITEINYDFEAEGNGSRSNQNSLGMELGGTMFNIQSTEPITSFPRDALKKRLRKFSDQYGHSNNNWAIITQHINANSEEVQACYSDEFNDAFALNALDLATQIPDTDPDLKLSSLFDHKPTLIDLGNDDRVIAHYAVPNFQGTKEVMIGGKPVSLSAEFKKSTINSFLPSESTFKECAGEVGFDVHSTFYDKDKKIAVHLMKYTRPTPAP